MQALVSDYLQKTLQVEKLIREPMVSRCQATIVFPVYNEPVRRILELLESVSDQEGVNFEDIEILCLVNNQENDHSRAYEVAKAANELILKLPIWKNGTGFDGVQFSAETRERAARIRKRLRAFVIDKSTPGNEIHGCNIGKARNRLLAEAVHRFYRNEKDGIVVMTDADAVYADPLYLSNVLKLFETHTDFLGGAGGIDFVFDPDVRDEKERQKLHQDFSHYILHRRWSCLSDFLLGRPVDMASPDACFGQNILSRASAAAGAGGYRPIKKHEDAYFFKDLQAYGARRGGAVQSLPHLRVNVALRESIRTDASFGHVLGDSTHGDFVRHPITGKLVPLTEAALHDLSSELATTTEGRAFLRRIESLPQVLYKNAFPV